MPSMLIENINRASILVT